MTEYITSEREQKIDFVNTTDLEEGAAKVIPKGGYGYIQSGAGDLITYKNNVKAFDKKVIVPGVLRDVEDPDTSVDFQDMHLTAPIIMAPVAAHGLAHVEGEKYSAKGVANFGSIFTASSFASTTLEDIREAGGQDANQWF